MTLRAGSLFSGIGGFEAGFVQAGMEIAWACEIDRQARAVLRRHHPSVEIYTDIKEMNGESIEPVGLLCGGFPCQDLSVAGKRAGLAGERSGLFGEIVRLLDEMRSPPRLVVLENVPGLLSADERRAMGTVLGALGKRGYLGGYRVLDLQFFGVPQRRRRVFFVLHLGDWRSAAEVLFESESVCGNPPARREKGAGVAALTAAGVGTCGADDNQGQAGHLIAHTTGSGWWKAGCVSAAVALAQNQRGELRTSDVHPQLTTGGGFPGQGYPCVATLNPWDPQAKRIHAGEVAPTLSSSDGGGGQRTPYHLMPTMAVQSRMIAVNMYGSSKRDFGVNQTDISHCLGTGVPDFRENSQNATTCIVHPTMAVRRLLPVECERLQGFPDNYTAWGIDDQGNRVEMSDSARYRMLGNAVGVPHSAWLGKRIMAAIHPNTGDIATQTRQK